MAEGRPPALSVPPEEATTSRVELPESRAARVPRSPLVLVVGDGEPLLEAIVDSLKKRGLVVATSPTERASAAAVARAPDLVVLTGDAAREGGQRTIRTLATRPTTAKMPVCVLEDSAGDALDRRLRALKAGALAIVDRSASADAMAGRITDLAYFVADHGKRTAAGIDVTIDELAAVIRKELGQLVPEDDPDALVEAPGREMAEAIERFVVSVRALVRRTDPEAARTRGGPTTRRTDAVSPEDLASADDGATHALRGARVLLVMPDAGHADALAQELRARGSVVVVSGAREEGLVRGRELDPEIVLLDADAARGDVDVPGTLARDARLRWAAVLVARWEELWPKGAEVPAMPDLAARVAPHRVFEHDLASRAHEEARLDVDLGRIGPCRALRALASVPHVLSITPLEAPGSVVVDVANGLVAGATQKDGPAGLAALAKFVGLPGGTLHVERRRAPSSANILLPVEDALALAGRELVATLPHSAFPPDLDDSEVTTVPGASRAPAASKLDFDDVTNDTAMDVPPLPAPRMPEARSDLRRPEASSSGMEPGALADALEPLEPPPLPAQAKRHVGTLDGVGPPEMPTKPKTTRAYQKTMMGAGAPLGPPPAASGGSLTKTMMGAGSPMAPPGPPPAGSWPRPLAGGAPPKDAVAQMQAAAPSPPPLPGPQSEIPMAISEVPMPMSEPPLSSPPMAMSEPPMSVPPSSTYDPPLGSPMAAASGSGAMAMPGSGAMAMPGSGAMAMPGSGAMATPGSGAMAMPGSGAMAMPGSGAMATPGPALGAPPARSTSTPKRRSILLPVLAVLFALGGIAVLGAGAVWFLYIRKPPEIASIPLGHPLPVVHAPPIGPPVGNTPVAPPVVNTPVAPPVVNAPVAPPVVNTPVAPPVVHAPVAPPVVNTPAAPPVVSTPVAPPVVNTPVPTVDTPQPPLPETPSALDTPTPAADESEALTTQARDMISHHDEEHAEALLLQAAEMSQRNPHPMELLARMYLSRGDGAHAVEWAEKLVSVRHRRASFRVLLGDARKLNGDQSGAESAWRSALELEPDNHDAHARLGE